MEDHGDAQEALASEPCHGESLVGWPFLCQSSRRASNVGIKVRRVPALSGDHASWMEVLAALIVTFATIKDISSAVNLRATFSNNGRRGIDERCYQR